MNEKELRQKFVDEAIKYVGVKEGSSKHKYIVDTYNKISPLPVGYKLKTSDAWCAAFTSFVAKECGLIDIFPAECSCNRQIELAKKMGIWVENDAYVPNVADLILYDWQDSGAGNNTGSSEHVGIVVSVTGNTIKVIEGNYDDKVGYRNIAVNGRYIRGYICPKYASKATKTSSTGILNQIVSSIKGDEFSMKLKTLSKGDSGEQVKALQILLMGRGQKLPKYGADGHYGDETVQAVKNFQKSKKIEQDGVAGKNTFSKLLLG